MKAITIIEKHPSNLEYTLLMNSKTPFRRSALNGRKRHLMAKRYRYLGQAWIFDNPEKVWALVRKIERINSMLYAQALITLPLLSIRGMLEDIQSNRKALEDQSNKSLPGCKAA